MRSRRLTCIPLQVGTVAALTFLAGPVGLAVGAGAVASERLYSYSMGSRNVVLPPKIEPLEKPKGWGRVISYCLRPPCVHNFTFGLVFADCHGNPTYLNLRRAIPISSGMAVDGRITGRGWVLYDRLHRLHRTRTHNSRYPRSLFFVKAAAV